MKKIILIITCILFLTLLVSFLYKMISDVEKVEIRKATEPLLVIMK